MKQLFHSNIDTINDGIGLNLAVILGEFLGALFTTIICFSVNWQLTLAMLVFLPFILGGTFLFAKVNALFYLNSLL